MDTAQMPKLNSTHTSTQAHIRRALGSATDGFGNFKTCHKGELLSSGENRLGKQITRVLLTVQCTAPSAAKTE